MHKRSSTDLRVREVVGSLTPGTSAWLIPTIPQQCAVTNPAETVWRVHRFAWHYWSGPLSCLATGIKGGSWRRSRLQPLTLPVPSRPVVWSRPSRPLRILLRFDPAYFVVTCE